MNGKMIQTPEEIAYEGRLRDLLAKLEAICPDFLLVTAHPGVQRANMFNRGLGWIHNLPALLAQNPGVRKALVAALLQMHLVEAQGPEQKAKGD